jgi:hypothetical protein
MSYNPNPVAKQATAANASKPNALASPNDASAVADADDSVFKLRTFDVFWVDKTALMHKDGFAKVRRIYRTSIWRMPRVIGSEPFSFIKISSQTCNFMFQ